MMRIGNAQRVKGLTLLLCGLLALPVWGAYQADFEGSETSWRPASSDVRYRIVDHRRVHDVQHGGVGCEKISLVAGAGTAVYFYSQVPHAGVIDELVPSVWVRADRPGIQLLVRIVLPRTLDPRTGQPITTIVGGPLTTGRDAWEQLRLQQIPLLLDRHVRVLRSQMGPAVDPREAYIDQIVLNLFAGPGPATVWIDDLEIAGGVAPGQRQMPGGRGSEEAHARPAAERLPATNDGPAGTTPQEVRLQGSVLLNGERPTLLRAITHHGEPLDVLKRIGFNAVRIATPPSPALLDQAARQGMWIIAPPPELAAIERDGIGQQYQQVLAWDMGSGLVASQREAVARRATALRRTDVCPQRPLLGECKTDHRAFSRILSVLVTGRAPLGTSLELAGFARWSASQPYLAVPGTPFWARIQTQLPPALQGQLRILAPESIPAIGAGPQEIGRLVWISLSAGAHGLLFDSASPLTATDAATRYRAETLELINLQLSLLEPWLASASVVSSVSSSDPSVTGALLHARSERARLLLPVHWQQGGQCVTGPPETEPTALVVPVPEPNRVYEATLGGLHPLGHKRVAGGMRVLLEQVDPASVVLLTQDPLVQSSILQRAAQTAPRASQLIANLGTVQLQQIARIDRRLAIHDEPARTQIEALLAAARADLEQSHVLRGSGKHQRAYDRARTAMHALARVKRIHYEHVVGAATSPVTSPLALTYATLPDQRLFAARLETGRLAANQLVGGDFEDLTEMRQAGWQHFQHGVQGLHGVVQLSPAEPHSGRFCLRLTVSADDAETAPQVVATPPLWITSPPVPVDGGQLVQIRGRVRVDMPTPEPDDGLLVIDSLTGAALAERIGPTAGWREFTLYRVVPRSSSSLTLTFALSSYGQADIDSLAIAPVALSAMGPRVAPSLPAAGLIRLPTVR